MPSQVVISKTLRKRNFDHFFVYNNWEFKCGRLEFKILLLLHALFDKYKNKLIFQIKYDIPTCTNMKVNINLLSSQQSKL